MMKSFHIEYRGMTLGKMDVMYSTGLIEQSLAAFRNQMLFITFAIVLIMVAILILIVKKLMKPVTELAAAASEIASGNLDREIKQSGIDEVGDLSRNFAAMRDAVKEKINDLARTNRNLEQEILLKEINEKKILRQSRVIASVNHFFQKSKEGETYEEIAQIFIPIALEVVPSRYGIVGEVSTENKDTLDILAVIRIFFNILSNRARNSPSDYR